MKEKFLSVLLIIIMLLSCACGVKSTNKETTALDVKAETVETTESKLTANDILRPIEDVWDASASGVMFTKNNRIKNAKGNVFKYDLGEVMTGGNLVVFTAIYAAITKEDYLALNKEIQKLIDDNGTEDEIMELAYKFYGSIDALFNVYAVKDGKTVDDLARTFINLGGENKDLNSYFDDSVVETIGNVDGWQYFYVYQKIDKIDKNNLDKLGDFKEDFLDLLSHADEYKKDIKIKGPVIKEMPKAAGNVSFSTKDLDGKEVSSTELFSGHKITMINVWATDCAPCIREMPELEELSKKFNADGYGLIGIITDGENHNSDAKEIIKDTGVTYPNVCMNEEVYSVMPIQVTPTTYFVDSKGNVLGEPIYGARKEEGYMQELTERLALIK